MYCCLTATILVCTELEWASCLRSIFANDFRYGFCNDSSWDLANTNWSHTWALIKWDQTTCNEGTQSFWVDAGGSDATCNASEGDTQTI